MMKFSNTRVMGFESAIHGMRNPLNSWDKTDSITLNGKYLLGINDRFLAQRLIKSGPEHCKFLRMIHVQTDVNMPRYWWSELDTYRFGTKNSCSTMHKLLNNNNQITMDMFVICEEDEDLWESVVERLESLRQEYKASETNEEKSRLLIRAKRILPEGFLQLRTWDTNYAELRNIYFQRKNHRLKEEWQDVFCNWVKTLPYFEELIGYEG